MLPWSRSNGRPAGRPYIKFVDDYNAMHMIWHYDEIVQNNFTAHRRRFGPFFLYDTTAFIQTNLTIYDLAENAYAISSANRYEVRAGTSVIVILQSE